MGPVGTGKATWNHEMIETGGSVGPAVIALSKTLPAQNLLRSEQPPPVPCSFFLPSTLPPSVLFHILFSVPTRYLENMDAPGVARPAGALGVGGP